LEKSEVENLESTVKGQELVLGAASMDL